MTHQVCLLSTAASSEELPFTVRVARSAADHDSLCVFRAAAYSRHDYTDSLAGRLAKLDEHDRRAFLLIALDKGSGKCVGTLRVSLTTCGDVPITPYEPLGIVHGHQFAYVDRFAVDVGPCHVAVRQALMKGMWLLACDRNVPWIVSSALAPLARLYRGVGLRPIPGAEGTFLNPKVHDTAPYSMCGSRTADLYGNVLGTAPDRARWFAHVHHPDIEMPWPPSPRWTQVPVSTQPLMAPEPVPA